MFFTPKTPAKNAESAPKAPEIADTFSAPQGAPSLLNNTPKAPRFLQPTDLVSDADLAEKERETAPVSQETNPSMVSEPLEKPVLDEQPVADVSALWGKLLKDRKKWPLCRKSMMFGFPICILHRKKLLMSTTENPNSD